MKAEGRKEGRVTILPVLNHRGGGKRKRREEKKKPEETLGQREEGTQGVLSAVWHWSGCVCGAG